MSTFRELRLAFAEAAGVAPPHESERWPEWVIVAAHIITPDPREMLTMEKQAVILSMLEFFRDAGPSVQDALVVAKRLGGDVAALDFVSDFLRERGI